MSVLKERIETTVRNIMSGNNECGTLSDAVVAGDGEFFRRMVYPSLYIYDQELHDMRNQRDKYSKAEEEKRQALEYVVQNIPAPGGIVQDYVEKALGRSW